MTRPTKYNLNIIKDLVKSSVNAFQNKNYLQSAIIIFQTVEALLRAYISGIAKSRGINTDIINKISEKEMSFYRLVLYLNLLEPKNVLLKKLYSFNSARNDFIHLIFVKFKDIKQCEKKLEDFCHEGAKLNEKLRKMMGIK